MLFFNYLRMSYENYRDLKDQFLIHFTQSDQTVGLQFQENIIYYTGFSNNEKYISISIGRNYNVK